MSFRGGSSLRLATAVGIAVAVGVPNALAGTSQVQNGQKTHPQVTPRVGYSHRTFHLSFTLAQAPGHSATQYTDYRAAVSAPAHARRACSPTQPASVTTGSQGEVKTIALHPTAHGWCTGQYDVTVYFQRATICGPPLDQAETAYVCPVTASGVEPSTTIGDVNTGETHFTIR